MIPAEQWQWFGLPGHFICADHCQFHLCTLVGDYLVSTVGQYLPDSAVRETIAKSRGVTLTGMGDAREADFLEQLGFQKIGCDRLFETMVFRVSDKRCVDPQCACGQPGIDPSDIDFAGYNTAGDAARGHLAMCRKWAEEPGR